jgi:signal peptidase I
MEKERRAFEILATKYQQRVASFKKVVEKWKMRGRLSDYQKGQLLLDRAQECLRQFHSDAAMDAKAKRKLYSSFARTYKELREITKPVWRQWAEAIVVAFVLALIFRNFIFGLYHVPTGSAEPNILVGDRIWGNKMAYFFKKPQRGELVIFDNPEFIYGQSSGLRYLWQHYVGFPVPILGLEPGPDNWVKRVIAVPGDTIEGRLEDNKTVIYLNGKKLSEPYVDAYPLVRAKKEVGFFDGENFGPISVPSFLQYTQKVVRYTFDPSLPLDKQPFYYLTNNEVIRKWDTGTYEFDYPFTPSYSFGFTDQHCVDVFGPFTLPVGKYWVMGDSRKNSRDSRYWLYLDEKLIHGRASFVIYSVDSEEACWIFDLLKHPIDFWTRHVRWLRFFKGLGSFYVAPTNGSIAQHN